MATNGGAANGTSGGGCVGCEDPSLPAAYPPWRVTLATAVLTVHVAVVIVTAALWAVVARTRFAAQRDGALLAVMFGGVMAAATLPIAEVLGPQHTSCLWYAVANYFEKLLFMPPYLVRVLRAAATHLQQARVLRSMADTPSSLVFAPALPRRAPSAVWGIVDEVPVTPTSTAARAPPSPPGFAPSAFANALFDPAAYADSPIAAAPATSPPLQLSISIKGGIVSPAQAPSPLQPAATAAAPVVAAAPPGSGKPGCMNRVLAAWEGGLQVLLVDMLHLHQPRRAWVALAAMQLYVAIGASVSIAVDPHLRPGRVGCDVLPIDDVVGMPLVVVFTVIVGICLPTIVRRRDAYFLRYEYIAIFLLSVVFGPLAAVARSSLPPSSPLRVVVPLRRLVVFQTWAHCAAAHWLPAMATLRGLRRRGAAVAPDPPTRGPYLTTGSDFTEGGSRVLTAGANSPTPRTPSALRAGSGITARRNSDPAVHLPQATLLFMVSTTGILIGTSSLAALPWPTLMTVCFHVASSPLAVLDARDLRLVAAMLAGTPLRDRWLSPLLQREMVSEQLLFLLDCLALRGTAARLAAAIGAATQPAWRAARRMSEGATPRATAPDNDTEVVVATEIGGGGGGGGGSAIISSSGGGLGSDRGRRGGRLDDLDHRFGTAASMGASGGISGAASMGGVGGLELATTADTVATLPDVAAGAPLTSRAWGGSSASVSALAGNSQGGHPIATISRSSPMAGVSGLVADGPLHTGSALPGPDPSATACAPAPPTLTSSALPLSPAAAASRRYLMLSVSALTAALQRLESRYLASFSPLRLTLSRATAITTAHRLQSGKAHLVELSAAVRAYNLEWLRTAAPAAIANTRRAFDAASHDSLSAIAAGPVRHLLFSPDGAACMADLVATLRCDPYRARPTPLSSAVVGSGSSSSSSVAHAKEPAPSLPPPTAESNSGSPLALAPPPRRRLQVAVTVSADAIVGEEAAGTPVPGVPLLIDQPLATT